MVSLLTVTLHAVIDDHFDVPAFRQGQTQRARSNESFPTGKGISTATALVGLGAAAETCAVVLCGDDCREVYCELLASLGVRGLVYTGAFRTRRHVTISDPTASSGGVSHIQVQGVPHPAELFSLDGALVTGMLQNVSASTLVTLNGSLPKGAPPDLYGTLVKVIRDAGGRTLLDTSGAALLEGLKAAPFAIKTNRGEAESIVGHELPDRASQAEAAASIRSKYQLDWVIISDGAAGAILSGAAGTFHAHVRLPESAVIITDQGCGDSMAAGFITAIQSEQAPADIAKSMLLAATANLFSPRPGQLAQEYIDLLASDVSVVEL